MSSAKPIGPKQAEKLRENRSAAETRLGSRVVALEAANATLRAICFVLSGRLAEIEHSLAAVPSSGATEPTAARGTLKQVASWSRYSQSAVRKWIKHGLISATKSGGKVSIDLRSVVDHLDEVRKCDLNRTSRNETFWA